MKIKEIILSSIILLFSPVLFAASEHNHDDDHGHAYEPVTQQQAEQNATRVVSKLINKEVIDKSWGKIKVEKSEKKQLGGKSEWVIIYKNEAIEDPKKRKLYVFLNLAGEYIAANYTGK